MISLDEMDTMLDEIATSFPQELYRDLNGGILLLPEAKLDPLDKTNGLYIMGEYCHDGDMGRYICIYYGSFAAIYGNLSAESLRERLTHTLKHEFVHHLESLAGEMDLEIEDEKYLRNYFSRAEGRILSRKLRKTTDG